MNIIIYVILAIVLIAGYMFLSYIYFYLSTMIILNKNIKKEKKLVLQTNKYIYFTHKGSEGIGIIYNSGDKEKPIFCASCIYDDKSIQHLELNKIDNYKFIDK